MELYHYNHFHDRLGRFTTSTTVGANIRERQIKRYQDPSGRLTEEGEKVYKKDPKKFERKYYTHRDGSANQYGRDRGEFLEKDAWWFYREEPQHSDYKRAERSLLEAVRVEGLDEEGTKRLRDFYRSESFKNAVAAGALAKQAIESGKFYQSAAHLTKAHRENANAYRRMADTLTKHIGDGEKNSQKVFEREFNNSYFPDVSISEAEKYLKRYDKILAERYKAAPNFENPDDREAYIYDRHNKKRAFASAEIIGR